ncbi:multimerin-1-like [Ostrea edulis]|uniref:multimerin-1-like n=1 Tax=Ostrea edulis TaxID=37623 RepID=UPI0024AED687|nr:multimerin-1-like [Ostrea edulis]
MPSPVFLVILCAISGITAANKKSPRPSLKIFRDDYATVVKTCEAVGYVKDKCKTMRGNSIVAFNAKASSTHSISGQTRATFNSVDLNIGGGYNAAKGIFTAPKSGIYVFEWTIMTYASKTAYTALKVNGKQNALSHCHNNNHGIYMFCTKLTIVRMEAGQEAWIYSWSGTSYIYGSNISSFSGFKL